ncbi:MAG: ankyrin repeat domain-containing protein [Sedimenticola sp.]
MKRTIILVLCGLSLCATGCSEKPDLGTDNTLPPLVEAAEAGDIGRLESLLSDNARVDVRDLCEWTPLMKAALNGHTEVASRLLDAGAAVDLGDKGGYTALMLAASNNHGTLVSLLLKHGADPNHREHTKGWTALIWAAKRGHEEPVGLLLAANADPSIRDLEGKSALDWAAAESHPGVERQLQGLAL